MIFLSSTVKTDSEELKEYSSFINGEVVQKLMDIKSNLSDAVITSTDNWNDKDSEKFISGDGDNFEGLNKQINNLEKFIEEIKECSGYLDEKAEKIKQYSDVPLDLKNIK